jgi:hypothetical protein
MIRNTVRYNKNTTYDDIKNVLYEFKNKDHKKEFQNIYKSNKPLNLYIYIPKIRKKIKSINTLHFDNINKFILKYLKNFNIVTYIFIPILFSITI